MTCKELILVLAFICKKKSFIYRRSLGYAFDYDDPEDEEVGPATIELLMCTPVMKYQTSLILKY